MATNPLKKEAYTEIMGIFRMLAYAGAPMTVIPFRMKEIMEEWDISNFEIDMLRREVIYEINYNINPI